MQLNFAAISRILYLGIVIAAMVTMGQLAYGWSLGETRDFALLIFDEWALAASWGIQLGPQALLLLYGLTQERRVRHMALAGAIGLNGLDAMTNVAAFYEYTQVADTSNVAPIVASAARVMGYIFALAVTWFEEVFVLLAGVALHLVALLLVDMGYKPSKWMRVDGVELARHASGASAAGIELPFVKRGRDNPPQREAPAPRSPMTRAERRARHSRRRPFGQPVRRRGRKTVNENVNGNRNSNRRTR